jgi:hypothetical protein
MKEEPAVLVPKGQCLKHVREGAGLACAGISMGGNESGVANTGAGREEAVYHVPDSKSSSFVIKGVGCACVEAGLEAKWGCEGNEGLESSDGLLWGAGIDHQRRRGCARVERLAPRGPAGCGRRGGSPAGLLVKPWFATAQLRRPIRRLVGGFVDCRPM